LIGHKPLQVANRHGIVRRTAPAALFARLRADAAQDGRQRDVSLDRGNCFAQLVAADLAQHERDVHVRRTCKKAGSTAVPDVVAEQQFERRAADVVDLGRLAFDLHAVEDLGGTGRQQPAGAAVLDHTYQAGSRRFITAQKAKRRNFDPQLLRSVQNRGTGRNLNFTVVDDQGEHVHDGPLTGIIHVAEVVRLRGKRKSHDFS
jgi:hypothetical protein